MKVYLLRSVYTYVYTRYYDKIDAILGSVFGMLGMLSLILFGIYKGYNAWLL